MANKTGKNFTRQEPGKPIAARTLNQGLPVLEGLSRLGVGRGLSQQDLFGGIPLLRTIGVQFAYARIGPEGIPARNETDPALIVPGKGEIRVYVRTEAGLVAKGNLEPCENVF